MRSSRRTRRDALEGGLAVVESDEAVVPSRGASAGEKMTMSPWRYLGVMLSPCTRAAKALPSFRSGQLT